MPPSYTPRRSKAKVWVKGLQINPYVVPRPCPEDPGRRVSTIASPLALSYIFPMTSVAPSSDTRAIAWWLAICAAMVFVMVVLGGATRLSESGLSMVEWMPLTFTPPLADAAWDQEFAAYRQSPQFEMENSWMTVEDFKGIYWLEYLHRLWGRIIGLAFAAPFAWFLYKRAVGPALVWKLAALFVLGGAQGALGWFMVASGLVDRPDVSQYRLAAHLFTALILFAALLWTALDLFRESNPLEFLQSTDAGPAPYARAAAAAVLLVMVSGAFVAGLDAGMIYNTFPLMDGRAIPSGLFDLSPWYANLFENIMTVQFNHRVLAMLLVAFIAAFWIGVRRSDAPPRARRLANALFAMSLLQAALGISTLLLVVPLPLALAHQTGALILFTLALCLAHTFRAPDVRTSGAPLHIEPAE